ncbi:hypothetical protein ASE93_23380 [Serratia sp. Leaf50]|nr:hypothetical protein ASE93_23380 [Serratia sp. Leaf50]
MYSSAKFYTDIANCLLAQPHKKALIKLYRLVLLDMIGVAPSLLKWSMQDSPHSFDFQYCLRRAELITRDEFIQRKGPAALKHA